MTSLSRLTPFLFSSAALILMGCKDDPIVTYRVPKEPAPLLSEQLPSAETVSRDIDWTVPSGWKEQPPSQMRVGSFSVVGKNGQTADVSVVSLGGDAGGDLANLNRWRGQINLPPISEAELREAVQTINPAGRQMSFVNIVSNEAMIDGKFKKRLMAATYVREGKSWFFKIMGDSNTVLDAKPAFMKFLQSLKFNDHE